MEGIITSKPAFSEQEGLRIWYETLVQSVRRDGPDLSSRQLAIFLQIYTENAPHTVRGISENLNIPKSAVTRALDRLVDLQFLKRERDCHDKRNVLVRRTILGAKFLSDFSNIIFVAASKCN